ncbi:2490_t:CDS:1 [Paraglomus brasilianum]|uniref:2490_t:CDS:1 n=1 Tax=Paraglomus brasilianum TaxID=144538 RepID=A0A9N9BR91_9GLOM|nr:2490_t:CDS:1 [Paraglomus brasilianum]
MPGLLISPSYLQSRKAKELQGPLTPLLHAATARLSGWELSPPRLYIEENDINMGQLLALNTLHALATDHPTNTTWSNEDMEAYIQLRSRWSEIQDGRRDTKPSSCRWQD